MPSLLFLKIWRVHVFSTHNIVVASQVGWAAKFPKLPPNPVTWQSLTNPAVTVEMGTFEAGRRARWYGLVNQWRATDPLDVPTVDTNAGPVPAAAPTNFSAMSHQSQIGYGIFDRLDDASFWHVVAAGALGISILVCAKRINEVWISNRLEGWKYALFLAVIVLVWALFGGLSLLHHSEHHGPHWGAYWTSRTFDSSVRLTQMIDETIFQIVALCAGLMVGLTACVFFAPRYHNKAAVAAEMICTLINAFNVIVLCVLLLVLFNWRMGPSMVPKLQQPAAVFAASWPIFVIGTIVLGTGWRRLATSGVKFKVFASSPILGRLPLLWFSVIS